MLLKATPFLGTQTLKETSVLDDNTLPPLGISTSTLEEQNTEASSNFLGLSDSIQARAERAGRSATCDRLAYCVRGVGSQDKGRSEMCKPTWVVGEHMPLKRTLLPIQVRRKASLMFHHKKDVTLTKYFNTSVTKTVK
eukprot:4356890-Amphidinium_carterae.1